MATPAPTPQLRTIAVAFATVITCVAAYTALQSNLSVHVVLPLMLLYVGIAFHAYASICCFQTIAPSRGALQILVDAVLAVLCVMLAWDIGATITFTYFFGCLFAVAAFQCAYLLRTAAAYDRLLKDAILVHLVCALSAFAVLPVLLSVPHPLTLWVWALVFWVVQYWVFIYRKLYDLSAKK